MRIGATAGRLLILFLLMVLLAPAAVANPTSADKARELQRARSQLERAQSDFHSTTADLQRAQSGLAEAESRLAAAQAKLQRIEADLEAAIAEHDDAVAKLDRANRRLVAATNRLDRVTQQLEEREDTFDARVSAKYKYGTITYAQALVGARDFTEFLQSFYYVRSALDFDRDVITEVMALQQEAAEHRAEIAELRDEARENEAIAKAARQRMEELAEEQRQVTEEIKAERNRRAAALREVERQRAQARQQVTNLEAESRRLERELRRLLERERWRAGSAPGAGTLAWPTDGRVTSGFGYRTHPILRTRRLHTGIDIPAPTGQRIVSAAAGRVVSAGWRGGYGLAVVIDHGGGMATLYAHMSRIDVRAGQNVAWGQRIGAIGSTGMSTGPHLHFEVRINGTPRDPMQWYR